MIYYKYVLISSKDNKLYVGWTPDIRKRIKDHNLGLVPSTKARKPLKLVFYEAFINRKDAIFREKFLKSGWGRRHLKIALKHNLAEMNIVDPIIK